LIFIQPAIDNPSIHKYIGAISFHAWRGCDNWTLSNWADAARELNVPLLIAEGGTDAQVISTPTYLRSRRFALDEINTFVRACGTGHVRSIFTMAVDFGLLASHRRRRLQHGGNSFSPPNVSGNLKQTRIDTPRFILPPGQVRPAKY